MTVHASRPSDPAAAFNAAIAAALRAQANGASTTPQSFATKRNEDRFDHPKATAAAKKPKPARQNVYDEKTPRPHVTTTKTLNGVDGEGHPVKIKKGTPAVSAIAGNTATLYYGGGQFATVKLSDLKKAVPPGARKNLERVIQQRTLDSRPISNVPEGTQRTIQLPPGLGQGWAPGTTGGESITGRGNPPRIWGTNTVTGAHGSRTGLAAMPMDDQSKFIVTNEYASEEQWTGPGGATGKAMWAEGWGQVDGKWVRQCMVTRIVPDDPTQPEIVFLPGGPDPRAP